MHERLQGPTSLLVTRVLLAMTLAVARKVFLSVVYLYHNTQSSIICHNTL